MENLKNYVNSLSKDNISQLEKAVLDTIVNVAKMQGYDISAEEVENRAKKYESELENSSKCIKHLWTVSCSW